MNLARFHNVRLFRVCVGSSLNPSVGHHWVTPCGAVWEVLSMLMNRVFLFLSHCFAFSSSLLVFFFPVCPSVWLSHSSKSGVPTLLSLLLCIVPTKAIHITYEPGWQSLATDSSFSSSPSRQVISLNLGQCTGRLVSFGFWGSATQCIGRLVSFGFWGGGRIALAGKLCYAKKKNVLKILLCKYRRPGPGFASNWVILYGNKVQRMGKGSKVWA